MTKVRSFIESDFFYGILAGIIIVIMFNGAVKLRDKVKNKFV